MNNQTENIYLTGFMGCGKSTIGRILSNLLGWKFCDLDLELEKREGRSVSQIFAEEGEAYFRTAETRLLKELLKTKGQIVALGGGTAVQFPNARLLMQYGAKVIWLDVSADTAYERLKNDKSRPLLAAASTETEKKMLIQQLLEQRRPQYQKVACQIEDVNTMKAEEKAAEMAAQICQENAGAFKKRIWVINGPNLNFLGIREPAVYGTQNYAALVRYVKEEGKKLGCEVRCLQSNYEGQIVDWLQEAYEEQIDGIVMNPGALTHYSYTLRDAIASVHIPTVEVHLSEIHERESFRHISVTKEVCIDQISGLGFASYQAGIQKIFDFLKKSS